MDNVFGNSMLTRRQMMARAAMLVTAASGVGSVLAACGDPAPAGDTASPAFASPPDPANVKGSAVYLNYPGWIGSTNVADFHKKFPEAEITESASGMESSGGVAQTVAQNPKAYDLVLCTADIAGQLNAGKLILPIDEHSVPSLSSVDPRFRELMPNVMPIDTDTYAIGYRKDLVSQPPRTWADFWRLVPQYSQKVVCTGIDRVALGIALIYKGFHGDSTDPDQLRAATDALIELKPNVRAFKTSDLAQPLADGTAVMSVGLSYEFVNLMAEHPDIDVIVPEDGTIFDVEAIAAVAATDVPEVCLAFMDFIMQPSSYANFINTTGAARTSKAADSQIDPKYLSPKSDVPANAVMPTFPGAEGVKEVAQAWQRFQSA